ncbi:MULTISPECIES: TerD family protein [unclassified Gordonia (in: high G+C Gram-positive bacteria)]|uniref:TerD family protein n=1 Tax=unclassified Gordonia (in: high G+C Gram-positive bacteria) TaxID=2657482 RepID=UPI000990CD38|nr:MULTISPECIES: TerD family protein [unclassified Gordonia (in: high G+C Gram-positive bacteria)]MCX2753861.1 TerD family protein [Gordonia sp. 4N]MDT0220906.1 TerD family protein [Gordonia sp. AC31]
MHELTKGSKTTLSTTAHLVEFASASPDDVDLIAVLLTAGDRVRTDDDLIFFNNPASSGVRLRGSTSCAVDLTSVPADVERIVVAASTEAQHKTFEQIGSLTVTISGSGTWTFTPPDPGTETVLQLVGFYRRNGQWKLDAIGQGYSQGLAAFATDFGITVDDEPEQQPERVASSAGAAPVNTGPQQVSGSPPVNMTKVKVSITKDSRDKTASIDLRKGASDWVLTVGLEWDGRGAEYAADGRVTKYGKGDLDVYFFCRDEVAHQYVVISGEKGHRGDLRSWPFIEHHGDSRGPGRGNKPAVEQVTVLPKENGDLLVNVYQSVDNGAGAIDKFGRPRVAIRYGRPGKDGLPGRDSDEILIHVGNGKNSFWATVAHIDVQDGVLKVDGTTRYSKFFSERMPTLDRTGKWVRSAKEAPTGRSKKASGSGLDRYDGEL